MSGIPRTAGAIRRYGAFRRTSTALATEGQQTGPVLCVVHAGPQDRVVAGPLPGDAACEVEDCGALLVHRPLPHGVRDARSFRSWLVAHACDPDVVGKLIEDIDGLSG